GVEYYLPLFFDALATLFDYLPAETTLVLHRDVPGATQAFWLDAQSRYKMMGGDPDRPLLPPAQLSIPAEEFYTRAKAFARVDLVEAPEEDAEQPLVTAALPRENAPRAPLVPAARPPLAVAGRAAEPLAALKAFVAASGLRVLISA